MTRPSNRHSWRWVTGEGPSTPPTYGAETISEYRWLTLHLLGGGQIIILETDPTAPGVAYFRMAPENQAKMKAAEDQYRPLLLLWVFEDLTLADEAVQLQ